ncbi:NAD(P)-dependent alcohol dehydrogenase [Flavobacterium praedii]|uniref:NAD(P)-dependent alcohol dehydrogenase n=1 Tax=Flavobacterium praedii TaxID=3002900 RepID=UPI002481DDD9|nr:NAD(P)-dependent alcohol dehydrogenase [Flavobacterium praedii]
MKAIVYTQYGSPEVLELKDVEKPIPKDNEILIRIRATAVNSGDVRLRKADPFAVRLFFGLFKPKTSILGSVFSGEIESIGSSVQHFKVGDEVFGHTDMSFGTYASYKCFPEDGSIALKPNTITHQEVAVIPFGGTTALHFLKKASVQKDQKVLVFGASGAVGTAAVQLAKYFGANVTGVCSTANIDLVKSLGADKVIDYSKEDFTKNGETYDLIFDSVNKMSISDSLDSLKIYGTLILSAAGLSETLQGSWISMTNSRKIKVMTGIISHKAEDINFLKTLIEAGQLKPVIDRTYSLEQMAEAHTYVEKGHKKGNIAIEIH